ncbi:unnamed protein product [Didymodactylos carnosus]|uniref:NADH dehydrogenase [ubiquinone] 1 beta subcomplex subunit 3 n=1 Tax=Didymodactylos carnosus TaxID=1234261 RepID=A0A814U053_9BILA|nr:unnamed protein product [Didymodactylos carnosus]CAF1169138.1 unnamed protein product [Didymodactylos carnosus]CAF3632693.1 unnamed protein product [Didymodactylos carnosus]CAF3932860.1 unnamed protein product [Didymodactylos carnosus]
MSGPSNPTASTGASTGGHAATAVSGDSSHHHHQHPDVHPYGVNFRIIDWRTQKVDGIPELEKLRTMLAARGLKDPWIRNLVWRYDRKAGFWPIWRRMSRTVLIGLPYAVVATISTLLTEKAIAQYYPPKHFHIHLYNPTKPHDDNDHHTDNHSSENHSHH